MLSWRLPEDFLRFWDSELQLENETVPIFRHSFAPRVLGRAILSSLRNKALDTYRKITLQAS